MSENKYRLSYHLMPPHGWMNDPNGLCYYKEKYHVFFQYAPESPTGKTRYWGHYISENLINWDYAGIALKSDTSWDRSGAYSGSSFTGDGQMELFYTGNVKEEGDYDYISAGRGANVITVKSEDGLSFSEKELLLTNSDYPADYTCHIRDPKVWKTEDKYYMLLGGRKKGDKGAILQYESKDKITWNFIGEVTTKEAFGYMWECPDAVTLEGKTILMCCPQGVERNELRFQNIYQSGYFVLEDRQKENLAGYCNPDGFHPWDYGFDFYAPQTMEDGKGRILLIGWAGMPDMETEYHNQPIIEEGWQHSLTVPRVLTCHNGKMYQYPVEELKNLRRDEKSIDTKATYTIHSKAWDLETAFLPENPVLSDKKKKEVNINDEVTISWEAGMLTLLLNGDCGCGRKKRQIAVETLENVRVLKDVSMLEIYVNDGEYVFTTRYFPEAVEQSVLALTGAKDATIWSMSNMEVRNLVNE